MVRKRGRPRKKAVEVVEEKKPEIKVEPEVKPKKKVILEAVCARCGHEESKHYGTPERNCNHCGCPCLAFVE